MGFIAASCSSLISLPGSSNIVGGQIIVWWTDGGEKVWPMHFCRMLSDHWKTALIVIHTRLVVKKNICVGLVSKSSKITAGVTKWTKMWKTVFHINLLVQWQSDSVTVCSMTVWLCESLTMRQCDSAVWQHDGVTVWQSEDVRRWCVRPVAVVTV